MKEEEYLKIVRSSGLGELVKLLFDIKMKMHDIKMYGASNVPVGYTKDQYTELIQKQLGRNEQILVDEINLRGQFIAVLYPPKA